jgi:N-methylhydantoinase B
MFFEHLELRTDSGGAGTFRGGLGLRRDIRFESAGEFLTVMKKSKTRPWALKGGLEPEPNGMLIYADSDRQKRVGTYRAKVAPGDKARNLTAGGGGYGPPAEREPSQVLEDVLDGYVSPDAARDIYEVALTDRGLDPAETARLRARPR